ncbi:hydrogenase maturation nickel metallochaperone HypA [Hahella sp. HN01]|uniref:hydrogenase maturation nickel metallochaperone HypA n=1 Tax=Hahella sp. HN01 TaxID=2847262 RepID=UPI001C1EF050|nr:hydrogenase maturation nickel metallochaperone HypA [Hahella sp. HN01]MBU6950268.1 hydrogenase maturation nickel metallochaperone HypA [Hahella sp. HN01]
MHELSIMENVVQLIEDSAAKEGFQRAVKIVLEIGELSHVETSAMDFCFSAVAKGTVVENATLEYLSIPGAGQCPHCRQATPLHQLYDPCVHCGKFGVQVTAGMEVRVRGVEVE